MLSATLSPAEMPRSILDQGPLSWVIARLMDFRVADSFNQCSCIAVSCYVCVALLSPAHVSRDIRPESRNSSDRWSVNAYVALIANETSSLRVVDHYAKEI
jgi:hypothetical protein